MPYTHVAIFIHWVTAILIMGLLAVGKFMTGLDETDSLRFDLTQTHKTFGILVLLLSLLRVFWRLTHRAPPHPAHAPTWEKLAANLSHLAFYTLIFVLPLSGWAMVSVSSLNIDTLLFNAIQWPHLPIAEALGLSDSDAKKVWEHRFHSAHHYASSVLIALLLVHIGAALKHHLVDKDDVLRRMMPRWSEPRFLALLAVVGLGIAAAAVAINLPGKANKAALVAQNSEITLLANISSEDIEIRFGQSNVVATIDFANPNANSLNATVDTSSATSDNLQVQGSLPEPDWFDNLQYPEATFVANSFSAGQQPNTLDVTGQLTIKDVTIDVAFVLLITPGKEAAPDLASTEFAVDRFALNLGTESQPNEDYVNSTVLIRVKFELSNDG